MENMKFSNVTGVGDLVVRLLTTPINPKAKPDELRRLSNADILAQVRRVYPNAKTTPASVAWYVSQLRQNPAYRAKHGGKEPLAAKENAKEVQVELPAASPAAK